MYTLNILYVNRDGNAVREKRTLRGGHPLIRGTALLLQDRNGNRYEGEVNNVIVCAIENDLAELRVAETIVHCTVREVVPE